MPRQQKRHLLGEILSILGRTVPGVDRVLEETATRAHTHFGGIQVLGTNRN
jgi:hypothetical protein